MNTNKPFFLFFTLFLIFSLISMACGLGTSTPASSPATLAAQTVQAVLEKASTDTAATATASSVVTTNTPTLPVITDTPQPQITATEVVASPQPSGPLAINFGGASMNVPAGLAGQANTELVPSIPFNMDSPFDMGSPAALKFTLDGYPAENSLFEPVITIMPISIFSRINPRSVEIFKAMKVVMESGTLNGSGVPFLPFFNAAQVFHAKLKVTPFSSGNGYRFITKYAQSATPLANEDIFYTFQAISSDGQYFISAILPVHANILPEKMDGQVPNGGINPPDLNDPDYGTKFNGYIQQVSAALDNLSNDQYTPNLDQLDAMMSSISLNGVSGLIPSCPGLLNVGQKVYVSLDPPVSNNLRSGPSKSEKVVDTIAPGTVIEILNGPTCADGLIYWQVRVPTKSNLTAYTAESDMKEQWLLPCPSSGSCP